MQSCKKGETRIYLCVHQGNETLWFRKQDYREALCDVFVFRVVGLVNIVMAAMVPVSRAAERIDSWLQAL